MKTYIKRRDDLIAQIIMDVKAVYPDDKEIMDGLMNLTTDLMVADPAEDFVNDLRGFRMWAATTNQNAQKVVSTILHDLSEFSRNRNQSWFCPRTTGYSKYLTGASNVPV